MRLAKRDIVLLREGDVCRWVQVMHADEPEPNGTQVVTVQSMEQYGRRKSRRIIIGVNTFVERFM